MKDAVPVIPLVSMIVDISCFTCSSSTLSTSHLHPFQATHVRCHLQTHQEHCELSSSKPKSRWLTLPTLDPAPRLSENLPRRPPGESGASQLNANQFTSSYTRANPHVNRINRLEAALKEVEAENIKTKATLAAVKAKLESLQRELDRHNAGLHYLAEASEKLRDGLGKSPPVLSPSHTWSNPLCMLTLTRCFLRPQDRHLVA